MHVRRDAQSAQEIVTLRASPRVSKEVHKKVLWFATWKLWETALFLVVLKDDHLAEGSAEASN